MFPIVHYYANLVIYGAVPPLTALGGLFPDLASGVGLGRDDAHQMGAPFHRWCTEEAPQLLPLARGILSHGILPFGVDYYADEYWPGCVKGWCFEQGQPWMERIGAVTHLPPNLLWWKSHNFVEMSYELLTIERCPSIGASLIAALNDQALTETAAAALSRYTGKDQEGICNAFCRAPRLFALEEVSARSLSERQNEAFCRRHHVYDADIAGMSALLTQMQETLRPGYGPFMEEMIGLVGKMLADY